MSKHGASAAPNGERIAKVIARAGVCSRRDAERLIAEGRVIVNGARIDTPAIKVKPDDKVEVDGKALPAHQQTRLWRYHKPPGLIVSHRDPKGRPTIFGALPKILPRVVSVGRLDLPGPFHSPDRLPGERHNPKEIVSPTKSGVHKTKWMPVYTGMTALRS